MGKKNKKPSWKTYNKKEFLVPESINSMAAVFCKIKNDGTAIIRISDCNQSVRIWNNLNEKGSAEEMLRKLKNLIRNLEEFKLEMSKRFL